MIMWGLENRNASNPKNKLINLDQKSLGGQLDGYHTEHAVSCADSGGFTYSLATQLRSEDTGLSQEYLTLFNPRSFLKVWAR